MIKLILQSEKVNHIFFFSLSPDAGRTFCPPVLRLPAAGLPGAVGLSVGRASRRPEPRQEEALPCPEGRRGPSRRGTALTWNGTRLFLFIFLLLHFKKCSSRNSHSFAMVHDADVVSRISLFFIFYHLRCKLSSTCAACLHCQ